MIGSKAPSPLVWESTTICYTRFISDSRYRNLRRYARRWYRPICPKCGPRDSDAIAMETREGGDGETRLHPKDDSAAIAQKGTVMTQVELAELIKALRSCFSREEGWVLIREATIERAIAALEARIPQEDGLRELIGFCESELIDPSRSPEAHISNAEGEAYFAGYEAAVEHIRDFVLGKVAVLEGRSGDSQRPSHSG